MKLSRFLLIPVIIVAALFLCAVYIASWYEGSSTCNMDGVNFAYISLSILTVWFGGSLPVLLVSSAIFFFTKNRIESALCFLAIFLTPMALLFIYFIRAFYCGGISGFIEVVIEFNSVLPVVFLFLFVAAIALVLMKRALNRLKRR